jgi:6-phosphogluconolactonase (cycloisomerase 2 family)
MTWRSLRDGITLALMFVLGAGGLGGGLVRADDEGNGAVYVLSNQQDGNRLLVLNRDNQGGIALAGSVATGGLGTGSGLGSQGALILGQGRRVLYAVNAGDHTISTFWLGRQGPQMVQVVDSGGLVPISLTARDDTLYVLNNGAAAQGVDQVTGFAIDEQTRQLSLLPGSTRGLSAGNVGPAQVSFGQGGKVLVVTEKNTSMIDTFLVGRDGYAGGFQAQASSGMEPFGFSFSNKGFLIVSEAFGGASGASDVSSYRVDRQTGLIHVISPSVATQQTAACWIAVTRDGKYAYSSNTGSGTITGFRVDGQGGLTRLNDDGVTGVTGGGPADSATVGNRYLYVLSHSQGAGKVSAFAVGDDGSLAPIGEVDGLPGSTVGLAAQ